MLMILEFFSQVLLTILANSLTMLSKLVMSDRLDMWRFLMDMVTSLMKATFSSLSLIIECLVELMSSSTMGMGMVRRVLSDIRHQLGCIKWLFNSLEPLRKNMRSITEFESLTLFEYLVRTWLVELDKSKLNKSVTMRRSSLMIE